MPAEGVPLSRRFSQEEISRIYDNLRRTGAPLGIVFGDVAVTANSHLALQASEFARDKGHFHSFHERVFYAYFTEMRDIGKEEVLLDLAEEDGLDREELRSVLGNHAYAARLADVRREGEAQGVTAVPTFIVEGSLKIVGVPSMDLFRRRLDEMEGSPVDGKPLP